MFADFEPRQSPCQAHCTCYLACRIVKESAVSRQCRALRLRIRCRTTAIRRTKRPFVPIAGVEGLPQALEQINATARKSPEGAVVNRELRIVIAKQPIRQLTDRDPMSIAAIPTITCRSNFGTGNPPQGGWLRRCLYPFARRPRTNASSLEYRFQLVLEFRLQYHHQAHHNNSKQIKSKLKTVLQRGALSGILFRSGTASRQPSD